MTFTLDTVLLLLILFLVLLGFFWPGPRIR